MDKPTSFVAPIVACCRNDPPRRALRFDNAADAHQYYISLLRNGTDALTCPSEGNGVCVCELRSLSPDEVIAWMQEGDRSPRTLDSITH